jgi:hypothetical protein
MLQPRLKDLISQTKDILAQGEEHSDRDETEAALRCYSVARQLVTQIKRLEVSRAWADAGQAAPQEAQS